MVTTTTTPTFDAAQLASGTSALTERAAALATSSDIVQAGAVFNDSTRLLDGGLWSTPADAHNQNAYLGMYTADIHSVLNDITAMIATPAGVTANGVALATPLQTADTAILTTVQGQLQTLLTDAAHAVGTSAAAIAAQTDIHTQQLSIINEIQTDPALATALNGVQYMTGTGFNNVGFQNLSVGADDAAHVSAATASGATLATIGTVFNAAADLAVGGLSNPATLAQFHSDIGAVATGVQNILGSQSALQSIEGANFGTAAGELTTVHLQTVENELQLQLNHFDPLVSSKPNVAARATNDNLLDIIDIVQNDASLNTAAGGTSGNATTAAPGFGEQPAYLTGTITHYQDNQAQTNFWANFITQANVLGSAAENAAAQVAANPALANSTAITNVIHDIQTYQQHAASFDQHQGGIFDARFGNELLGGTLEADASAAITAIQNGNVAQATAAANGFIADAADVSGNNIPLGGGTFVSQLLTVNGADAPNPNATVAAATTANGVATASHATTQAIADAAALGTAPMAVASTTGTTGAGTGTGTGAGAAGTGSAGTAATGTGAATTAATTTDAAHHDQDHSPFDFGHHVDHGHNFAHMWG